MSQQPVKPDSVLSGPFLLVSLCLVALTIFLGYFADRNHFLPFISAYGLYFGIYCWLCFFQKHLSVGSLIALGIGLRVLLLFSMPNLSDDYARFLWDGRLTLSGFHPFLHTPSYFIEHQILPVGINIELYNQLNSPDYFTVYPPVCQGVFALAALIAPENNWLGVIVMKLCLFAAELGVVWVLVFGFKHKGDLPGATDSFSTTVPSPGLLYALNPLIILELVGNCHFEGMMVFFLLLGMLALARGNIAKSAIFWALGIATKLIPLLFLPLLWRWLGWRKGFLFLLVFGLSALLLFAPLLAVLPNILESLDLYFREFQFNASVYYLVREIGYAKIGWDIGEFSGPRLAFLTLVCLLIIALFARQKKEAGLPQLLGFMLFSLLIYLSLAAVVQPWYLCVLFTISLFTHWRFALLWTGLVTLSYSHYDGGERQEHFWLIGLEYVLLWGFVLWEIWGCFNVRAKHKFVHK